MFSDLKHAWCNKYDRTKLRITRAMVKAGKSSMRHRKREEESVLGKYSDMTYEAMADMLVYARSSRNHLYM